MQKAGIALVEFGICFLFSTTMQAEHTARTIEVHVHRYAFEPSEISMNAGETVRLRLISDDVPHSLVVKQLSIDLTATKSNPGEFVFKADTPGDYAGRCGRFCGSAPCSPEGGTEAETQGKIWRLFGTQFGEVLLLILADRL